VEVAIFPFHVGRIAGWMLRDAADALPLERLHKRFPTLTEPQLHQGYADAGYSVEQAHSSANVMLLRAGDALVLVDSGQGGRLASLLPHIGLSPADITHLILTHTHIDHVGGLVTPTGDPHFPQAHCHMMAAEWAFWQAGSPEDEPARAWVRAHLTLVEEGDAIVPGVSIVGLPGHTPGHIGLMVESEGERLLHLSDLLHSLMQFPHPEWSARFDRDVPQSVATRRVMLAQAADEQTRVVFYHLRFPGIGQVQRVGTAFGWQPEAVF